MHVKCGLDLGERRRGERPQLAAAPPDGVVSVRRAHIEQTLPLSRLADHAQLPVFILPDAHLKNTPEIRLGSC